MLTIYKTYFRCDDGETIYGAFGREIMNATSFTFNGVREEDGSYSSAPAWFSEVNLWPMADVFWEMEVPDESGTKYNFSWTVEFDDGTEVEYLVQLVMLTECGITTGCSTNSTLLTWLTREGGWQVFTFNGKTTFDVTIPEAESYMDSNRTLRVASRNGVYKGELLTTGDIPQEALDLMESLKYSAQVYKLELLEEGDYITPVYVMDGDYTKRKTGDRIFDVSVKIIYAEEVQIQTG